MKKSACIEMLFTELDFYHRFQAAKEAGFKYVEFWGWEDKDLQRIKELTEKYDLTIASFSGDRDYSPIDQTESKAYIEFVGKSIEAAKFLNCKNLVIHSNALGEGGVVVNHYNELTDKQKFGTLIKVLMAVAPLAEEADVTLVLEALNTVTDHVGNYLAYTKDAVDAIKIVASSHIKILYDIYHMQLMEGKIVDTIKAYSPYMGYVHVADAPGRMEPGTGEINYERVWQAYKEVGYGGYIGFELAPSKSSVEVAKELVEAF